MDLRFVSVIVLVGLIASVSLLVLRLGREHVVAREARRRAAAFEKELQSVQRFLAQAEQDQQFFSQFLREFPHLTRELHSGVSPRQLPSVLLNVVMRTLEPRQALVLVRRRRAKSDPARGDRLVVAAAAPADGTVKVGAELLIGEGELGFAAEAQVVMSRQDLEAKPAATRAQIKRSTLPGFELDLAAPMVLGEETLGLIALAGARRVSEDTKAALRLIAQTGAQAIHSTAAYEGMRATANRDGLTGVFNKAHMSQTLAELILDAEKSLSALSIVLFDIDNFKNYNDLNGHLAGDQLLRELAGMVHDNIRKNDVFGRFGGEEFLLILPKTSLAQALAVAYKVRGLISGHGFAFAERQPLGVLSVSGGVAEYPADGVDSAALLRAADDALYGAKRQGRNRMLAATRQYLDDSEPKIVSPDEDWELDTGAAVTPRHP